MTKYIDYLNAIDFSSLTTEERKAIDNELRKIKRNINDVINSISEINTKEKIEKQIKENKKYVGKCYKLKKGYVPTIDNGVFAFKVLQILPRPNEQMSECIVLFNGHKGIWKEKGIKMAELRVFGADNYKLMTSKDCIRFIDNFEECDEEEFKTMICQFYDEVLTR